MQNELERIQMSLAKTDLLAMIKGISPSWKAMSNPIIAYHGAYSDHYGYQWDMSKLSKLDIKKLVEIINYLKEDE